MIDEEKTTTEEPEEQSYWGYCPTCGNDLITVNFLPSRQALDWATSGDNNFQPDGEAVCCTNCHVVFVKDETSYARRR